MLRTWLYRGGGKAIQGFSVERESGYKSVSWQEAHEDLLSAFPSLPLTQINGQIVLSFVDLPYVRVPARLRG